LNVYLNAGIYFLLTSIVILIAICLFDLITKYKVWDEITKGNVSVALATGGVVIGVANILKCAITTNEDLIHTIIWGGIGSVVLLIVYLAFEALTPRLNVTEEIGKGNIAVGVISFVFSLAFSLIIGASIS
jgi:putative membrane protein